VTHKLDEATLTTTAAYQQLLHFTLKDINLDSYLVHLMEDGTNSITYRVLASNVDVYASYEEIVAPTVLSNDETYEKITEPWLYLIVEVVDTVPGVHGVVTGILSGGGPSTPKIQATEDTGEHTNPEQWLHDNHWEPTAQIAITVAGAPGEQNVGAAVAAGKIRRIREVTARHTGSVNTVVSILDATAGNIKLSFDVPPQSTRTWSSQDGRAIAATLQPVVQTSDVTGGPTYVSAAGVEVAQN
jgi:hypothetical protein